VKANSFQLQNLVNKKFIGLTNFVSFCCDEPVLMIEIEIYFNDHGIHWSNPCS